MGHGGCQNDGKMSGSPRCQKHKASRAKAGRLDLAFGFLRLALGLGGFFALAGWRLGLSGFRV